MTKRVTTIRFSEAALAAVEQLTKTGSLGHEAKMENRTACLEQVFAHWLYNLMRTEKVNSGDPDKKWKPRFQRALNTFPEGVFELYVEFEKDRKQPDLLDMETDVLKSMLNVPVEFTNLTLEHRQLIADEINRRGKNAE